MVFHNMISGQAKNYYETNSTVKRYRMVWFEYDFMLFLLESISDTIDRVKSE